MALPFQENFTGDNNPLSGRTGWSLPGVSGISDSGASSGGLYIDDSGSSDDKGAYADGDTYNDDQYAQVTVGATGDTSARRLGVLLRCGSGSNGYAIRYQTNDNTFHAYYWNGGSRTEIGTAYTATALTATDKFKVEITGSSPASLDLFIDTGSGFGSSLKTWSDSTGPTSGSPGVYIVEANGGWKLDDFEGGNLSGGASAAITGTATASIIESDIVTGGKTIIVTLTGDTWKAAGTGPIGSTADTQALIDGFDAATSPTNGWNNEVRDKAATTEVIRTSSTVATWTIAAQSGYDVAATETITGTIPTAALTTGAAEITATPTFTVDAITAATTGTATASITEADIVTGGKTILLTLTNDTWVTAGATFDAQRQNIIDGLDSAQSETAGWDAEVKANLAVTTVVRTSATVVTVTLSAQSGYDITATETITATIPATALTSSGRAIVSSPTFAITSAVGYTTSEAIVNNTGTVLSNTAVVWNWLPLGRIGTLNSITALDGTGTTDASGFLTVTGMSAGAGILLIADQVTDATDDLVYYEAGTAA